MKATQPTLKKEWVTPQVLKYGSVNQVTRQIKCKTFGTRDDFNTVPPLSTTPGCGGGGG